MQRGHCRSFAAVLLCGGDAPRQEVRRRRPAGSRPPHLLLPGRPQRLGVDVHRAARRRVLVAGVHRVRRVDVRARGPLEGLPRRLRLRLPELVDAVLARTHRSRCVSHWLGPHVLNGTSSVGFNRCRWMRLARRHRSAADWRTSCARFTSLACSRSRRNSRLSPLPRCLGPGPPRAARPQTSPGPAASPARPRPGRSGLLRPPALAAQRARPLDGVALRDGEGRAVRLAGLLGGALLVDGAGRAVDRLG